MPTSACTRPGKAEGGTGRPPAPKKRGGETNKRQETDTQPRSRAPTQQEAGKPPSQATPKEIPTGPPERTPEYRPAKPGNTQPRAAARRRRGHPGHAGTHFTGEVAGRKKKKKRHGRSSNDRGMGDRDQETQDQDRQLRTPQSHDTTGLKTTTPPRSPKKHNKRGGGGAKPTYGNPRTPPRHRQPHQKVAGNGRGARKRPDTPTPEPRKSGVQAKPKTHTHTPRTPAQRQYANKTRVRTHKPDTSVKSGEVTAEPNPKSTHHETQAEMAGQSRRPSQRTRTLDPGQEWRSHRGDQTQTQTPHNNRKPSVHGPGTEAARAMQVTQPNEIRRPGSRLHPKACAGLGLEAERATPKHPGTPVPRTCMHALGTGYDR